MGHYFLDIQYQQLPGLLSVSCLMLKLKLYHHFQESAEAEPITVIPGTPETEPTDSDAPSANEDSELSEPTNGESSQESTEDESEIFLTPPEEEESDKPAKKSGKKAEKRQSRSRVAPATPEKRVQPAIPGKRMLLLLVTMCKHLQSFWFNLGFHHIMVVFLRGFSSAGRAPALQAGGHRFDPGKLHQVLSFSIYIVKWHQY